MLIRRIIGVIFLSFIWVILSESLTWQSFAVGAAVGIVCMFFIRRFMPFKSFGDVKFSRLITFPFFLIGQVYLSGLNVIKTVLKGADASVSTIKTNLKDEGLIVLLGDAVTLTPGSILLEINNNEFTLLWIKGKNAPAHPEAVHAQLLGVLERRLLKAQR